jgi:hypothetical protein
VWSHSCYAERVLLPLSAGLFISEGTHHLNNAGILEVAWSTLNGLSRAQACGRRYTNKWAGLETFMHGMYLLTEKVSGNVRDTGNITCITLLLQDA